MGKDHYSLLHANLRFFETSIDGGAGLGCHCGGCRGRSWCDEGLRCLPGLVSCCPRCRSGGCLRLSPSRLCSSRLRSSRPPWLEGCGRVREGVSLGAAR